MVPQQEWKTACLSKKTIAKDIVEFRMARPGGFQYIAGQFVQFVVPVADGAVLRAYSIASHPAEDTLEFCIKMLPGGRASSFFAAATLETSIVFQGPNGKFTCGAFGTPLSFVATGAGLAPIWGIISDELLNKKNTHPMRLIFGVRSEEDVFWIDRLDSLGKQCSNFSYQLTLSQPRGSWQGTTGRVMWHLGALPNDSRFFLCGNMDMVKDVRAAILARDIPPANVLFEIF